MTPDRILRAIDATLTATEAPMPEPTTAIRVEVDPTRNTINAAPYDAGDAAPRRHIALTPPTADEQLRAVTAQLNRSHAALRELEGERDDLQTKLANVTANGDHLRERLTEARRHINGLEADLRTARRDCQELAAELGQTRADHAAALELLTVYSDAHERIDRARAIYATRPRQDAAEPPHSAAGDTEAHDVPTEAHRGAEAADDDELDAADLADAMEHAESALIDRDDSVWRPSDGAYWTTRYLDPMTRDEIEQAFGPTRAVLLIDIEQDEEQDVDQAERDATLAQIARDAAQSAADVAAGRVSDHLGDPPPAARDDEQAPDHAGAKVGFEVIARALHRDGLGALVSGAVVASAVSTRPTLAEAVDELRHAIGPVEQEG